MISTISREGIRPLCDGASGSTPVKDGVGYSEIEKWDWRGDSA